MFVERFVFRGISKVFAGIHVLRSVQTNGQGQKVLSNMLRDVKRGFWHSYFLFEILVLEISVAVEISDEGTLRN